MEPPVLCGCCTPCNKESRLAESEEVLNEERGGAHWHWPVHFDDHVSSHSRLPSTNVLVALDEALWCQTQHKSL